MTDKKAGVALIGAGSMGSEHAKAWAMHKDISVKAIADTNLKRAEKLAGQVNCNNYYTDFKEAVERDDVSIVSICTPAYFHPIITLHAAKTGKHILCEKPMALNLESAYEMHKAALKNKVKLAIGFNRRCSSLHIKLKEIIQESIVGRPLLCRINATKEIRPKSEMHDALYGNGGPVIDDWGHFIDLWRMIFDAEPISVTAKGFTFAEGRRELKHIEKLATDTAAAIIEYDSGDVGEITSVWGLPPGIEIQYGRIEEILGPGGIVTYKAGKITVSKENGKKEIFDGLDKDHHYNQTRMFADCVLHDREPVSSSENGIIALKVANAVFKSMKTGETVRL